MEFNYEFFDDVIQRKQLANTKSANTKRLLEYKDSQT